jgi:hypothetical protein
MRFVITIGVQEEEIFFILKHNDCYEYVLSKENNIRSQKYSLK